MKCYSLVPSSDSSSEVSTLSSSLTSSRTESNMQLDLNWQVKNTGSELFWVQKHAKFKYDIFHKLFQDIMCAFSICTVLPYNFILVKITNISHLRIKLYSMCKTENGCSLLITLNSYSISLKKKCYFLHLKCEKSLLIL